MILLVYPNFNRDFLRTVPVGISHIAASFKRQKLPFTFLDLTRMRMNLSQFYSHIRNLKFKYAGFGCYPWTFRHCKELIPVVKRANPEAKIIMGGPTATGDPELVFSQMPDVDYIVRGEAESTAVELIDALEKRRPGDVNNVCIRRGDEIVHTPVKYPKRNLVNIASPILEGIYDLKDYDAASIGWTRGCLFTCSYCSWGSCKFLGKHRVYPEEYVLEELDMCRRYSNIKLIISSDGVANFSKEYFNSITDKILKRNYQFSFRDFDLRADMTTKDQLRVLKRMGVYDVGFGLETIRKDTQKIIRKNLDYEKMPELVHYARRIGLAVHVSFIIGLPGETEEDVMNTVEYLRRVVRPTEYGTFCLRAQPGTEIYNHPGRFGIRLKGAVEHNSWYETETDYLSVEKSLQIEEKLWKKLQHVSKLSTKSQRQSDVICQAALI